MAFTSSSAVGLETGARVDKRRLRRAFGRAAQGYDGYAELQRAVGGRLLDLLGPGDADGAEILDVGAGTGFCSAALAPRGAGLIALDLAPEMLMTARRNLPPGVHYLCADAEAMPLADNSVDLVCSNLALQWCQNLAPLFAGIARVLRPGGRLVFSSFGPATLGELRAAWAQVDRHRHVNDFYAPAQLEMAMRRAGLTRPAMKTWPTRVHYDSVMGLMANLKGIGARNATEGQARGLTGKGKLRRLLDVYESASSPGVAASFEVLFVSARKPTEIPYG